MTCSLHPAPNRCPCRSPRPIDPAELRKTNYSTVLYCESLINWPFATLSRGDPAHFNNPPLKVAVKEVSSSFLPILRPFSLALEGDQPCPFQHLLLEGWHEGGSQLVFFKRFPAIGIILMASRPEWQRLSCKKRVLQFDALRSRDARGRRVGRDTQSASVADLLTTF